MTRGEVWWARLPQPWGRRSVLLVARDEAYSVLSWVVVAPLTTTIRDIPSAVLLTPERDGVPQRCVVALDSLQAVQKAWLDSFVTRLTAERMGLVDRAIHFAVGIRA